MGQKLISSLFWELVKKEFADIDPKYQNLLSTYSLELFMATNANAKAGMDFSTAVKLAACTVAGKHEIKED